MLNLTPLKAFNDNYIWLLQNQQSYTCAVVDPGDATPVLAWLKQNPQWQLSDILITHHHHDHTDGIARLKQHSAVRVLGPALEDIPQCDLAVTDQQSIEVLGQSLTILHVPGHTLGHVAYFCSNQEQPFVLTGDTLFAGGCGRLFEGTPEQMYQSLQRLAQLPDNCLVYCAHEYTLGNQQFAAVVEPDNPDVQQRLQQVQQLRQQEQITLPVSIAQEKRSNPFLRCHSPAIIEQLTQQKRLQQTTPVAVFTALRAWKDSF